MVDCIFCQILGNERPATFVYRDETVAAFMDIQPVNPGHVLVVPVKHAAYLADGEAAMQEVLHVHLHVFPRYGGDGFGLRFGPQYKTRPPRPELDRIGWQIPALVSRASP
jgi:histidine triad (HIT) family protein